MTNVFEFPKDKIVRDVPIIIEELEKAKEKGKMNYADGVVSEISQGLFEELENYGIDVAGENTEETGMSKDFIFLTDVLKSLIYRTMGIDHSLHSFVDENVAVFSSEKDYNEFLEKMDVDEEIIDTEES